MTFFIYLENVSSFIQVLWVSTGLLSVKTVRHLTVVENWAFVPNWPRKFFEVYLPMHIGRIRIRWVSLVVSGCDTWEQIPLVILKKIHETWITAKICSGKFDDLPIQKADFIKPSISRIGYFWYLS